MFIDKAVSGKSTDRPEYDNVNLDFSEISYIMSKTIYNRTKGIRSETGVKTKCYKKFYGKYNCKVDYIQGIVTKYPKGFPQVICWSKWHLPHK